MALAAACLSVCCSCSCEGRTGRRASLPNAKRAFVRVRTYAISRREESGRESTSNFGPKPKPTFARVLDSLSLSVALCFAPFQHGTAATIRTLDDLRGPIHAAVVELQMRCKPKCPPLLLFVVAMIHTQRRAKFVSSWEAIARAGRGARKLPFPAFCAL